MKPALVLLALVAVHVLSASAQDRPAGTPPYVPSAERYGVAWGDLPEAVVARFGPAPDATEPEWTLAYVGRGGGQALFVFERESGGADRLVADATPGFEAKRRPDPGWNGSFGPCR